MCACRAASLRQIADKGADAFYRGETVYSGSGGFPEGPDDWEDDEANELYYREVGLMLDKWTGRAATKLARKSPFHGKKMKAFLGPKVTNRS